MQPRFVDVAKIIGDVRLAKPLRELARNVEIEIHNAVFIAKPTEVRRDVERLRNDARRFEAALKRASERLLDLPLSALTFGDDGEEKTFSNVCAYRD